MNAEQYIGSIIKIKNKIKRIDLQKIKMKDD